MISAKSMKQYFSLRHLKSHDVFSYAKIPRRSFVSLASISSPPWYKPLGYNYFQSPTCHMLSMCYLFDVQSLSYLLLLYWLFDLVVDGHFQVESSLRKCYQHLTANMGFNKVLFFLVSFQFLRTVLSTLTVPPWSFTNSFKVCGWY